MVRFILALAVVVTLFSCLVQAQSSEKQKRLTGIERSLADDKEKLAEIEGRIRELEALKSQAKELAAKIETDQQTGAALRSEIEAENEEARFQYTLPRNIADVSANSAFLVDFESGQRWVSLHGIQISSWQLPSVAIDLRKKYRKKKLFVRCIDVTCQSAYFYEDKFRPSLNALFVRSGLAVATADARFDVTPASRQPTITSTPGTEVQVRGYYRKDGTYVRPHTRSRPRR